MSSTRQPPMGTPQLGTHAGLTPQMSIVDANGRPTMFFFRWLLTIGGAALAASDSSILEAFDPGADAALTESAIADALDAAAIAAEASLTESAIAAALDAAGTAAGFDDSGAARADLTARIEELELAGALRTGGDETGPSADQRALEALLMADAPAVPAAPIAFLADTLANWTAANYNPANYANGQQFVVTTWQVTYAVEAGVWRYIAGVYIAPAAARPATAFNGAALGAADTGLRFLASDTDAYQYWNGAAWVVINAGGPPSGPAGGGLGGTYPNPAVVEASGNFTVLGDTITHGNAGGSNYFFTNSSAGASSLFIFEEAGAGKAQFGLAGGNSYFDYNGEWDIRAGYGGSTIARFDPTGILTVFKVLQLGVQTVAILPPAGGAITCVTDALAPVVGNPVVGGGAVVALVWNNGGTWKVLAV